MTSWAFLLSIKSVTWFKSPCLTPVRARQVAFFKRSFFAFFSSGAYFLKKVSRRLARVLSAAELNTLTAGGTLRRLRRTLRWRWMRTYLGHLRTRSRAAVFGRMSPPILKFLGLGTKSFAILSAALAGAFLALRPRALIFMCRF